MPRYTIVLPVRNGGHHIKECIASILGQTYTAFDLIVLENGSTDGTAEWLKSLADTRVQVLPAERSLNIAENWNRAVGIAKNEFMTLIGHDDLLLPHYLEGMDQLIAKHPAASLYQSHFNFIDAKGGFIKACLPMDEVQTAHELLASLTMHTLDSMGTGYMFRSADYDALGGISPDYPDLLFADNALWVSLAEKSYKATTFKNCFSYRLHQSLSRTTKGMDYYRSFTEYIKYLQQKAGQNANIKVALERYGRKMLYEFCEAVAHRLLKTPVENRSVSVKQFVEECIGYAETLIPGQAFEPYQIKKIKLAVQIDENPLLRTSFQFLRKNYSGKL